jgi:spore coat protein H
MRILPLLLAALGLGALFSLTAGAASNPLSATQAATQPIYHALPHKASQLFEETMVWTVHLKFTPEQWAAIEPKQNPQMAQMRRGGGRGMGPEGGLAGLLVPSFLKAGDQDRDGKLSKAEFTSIADHWFTSWDSNKAGKLNGEQLRLGLTSVMGMPAFRLQGAPGQRNGLAASQGIEFVYVHADLEFEGQTVKDVGVRYKGNGTYMNSQGQIKKSFKVDMNHFVEGQKFAGITKLNLHNNVTDASWMNEPLSHKLYRDAGIPAPRSAYAKVYVSVPGLYERKYFGLYSIIEDVDKHLQEAALHTKEGAIFKPVTPNLFDDLGDDWDKYKQTYDPKTNLTAGQIKRVIEFSRFFTKASDEEFAARLGEFLDLDEFARYMAVTTWLSTLDSILGMGQNFYVYLDPKTNKFQFLPWDLDHSFGQFGMGGDQAQREELSINQPWRGNVHFLERVYKVEAFKKLYLAKFQEFNKTIFVPQRFLKQVDEFGAALRPAVKEESAAMLERFDKVVAGEAVAPNRGRGGFGAGVKPIKGFVVGRAASVTAQTEGKSQGVTLNGGGRGPGGGGPGNMLAPAFMTSMDTNKDGDLSREEFAAGFDRWFTAWNTDKSGTLTEEQLRLGLGREFTPQRNNRGFFGIFGGGGNAPPPPAPVAPGTNGQNDAPPNAGPNQRQPDDVGRRGRGNRGNGRFGQ